MQTFKCLNCGTALGFVDVVNGRTALSSRSTSIYCIRKAEVKCFRCGSIREFHSIPETALRLAEWVEERTAA